MTLFLYQVGHFAYASFINCKWVDFLYCVFVPHFRWCDDFRIVVAFVAFYYHEIIVVEVLEHVEYAVEVMFLSCVEECCWSHTHYKICSGLLVLPCVGVFLVHFYWMVGMLYGSHIVAPFSQFGYDLHCQRGLAGIFLSNNWCDFHFIIPLYYILFLVIIKNF